MKHMSRMLFEDIKQFLKNNEKVTDADIADLCKDKDLSDTYAKVVANVMKSTLRIKTVKPDVSSSLVLNYVDLLMYFYDQKHCIVRDVTGLDYVYDSSFMNDIEQDFTVQFTYNGTDYLAVYNHANYPQCIKDGTECNNTIVLLTRNEDKKHRFQLSHWQSVIFWLPDGVTNRAYFISSSNLFCSICGGCNEIKGTNTNYRSLRRDMSEYEKTKNCVVPVPLGLVYALGAHVTQSYNDVERINRKNYKRREQYERHEIVHVDNNDDREVPLRNYKYVYKESIRSVYKGGHHASPVAHDVRGFYRKSSIGDHIQTADGFWEEVPKGTGTHTWVKGFRRGKEEESSEKHVTYHVIK